MATPAEFSQQCREAARSARRLPTELRRALAARTRDEVTEPMAARMRQATSGPHAVALSAGIKARVSATPDIVIGGARPKLTGGAGPRNLVYGNEFGSPGTSESIVNRQVRKGRKRRGVVTARERAIQSSAGSVIYRRKATRQFMVRHPFIFRTLNRDIAIILDGYAAVVDDVLDQEVD